MLVLTLHLNEPSPFLSPLTPTSVHRGKSSGAGSNMANGAGDREDRVRSNAGAAASALLYPGDSSLATTLLAGVKAGKGESWARCEFNDYTQVYV